MLIKSFISNNQPNNTPLTAYVSYTNNNKVSAISDVELKDIPIVSIPGIYYLPNDKSNIIAIPIDEEYVCIGSIIDTNICIEQGELLLSSKNGAYIKLCNNGDAIINGLIINKNGKIVSN